MSGMKCRLNDMGSSVERLIESRFPEFRIYGEHANGSVDVADTGGDVASNISREQADRLISSHNQAIEALARALQYVQDAGGDAWDVLWDRMNKETGDAVPGDSDTEVSP